MGIQYIYTVTHIINILILYQYSLKNLCKSYFIIWKCIIYITYNSIIKLSKKFIIYNIFFGQTFAILYINVCIHKLGVPPCGCYNIIQWKISCSHLLFRAVSNSRDIYNFEFFFVVLIIFRILL